MQIVKKFIEDLIYVLIWSVGLLYGSFHRVLEGTQTYVFANSTLKTAVEDYVFPMIMAMLLFLFDSIYSMLKDRDEGRQTNIIAMTICFSAFLLCFMFPLLYEDGCFARSAFFAAWGALTIMKLITTFHVSPLSSPKASLPNND